MKCYCNSNNCEIIIFRSLTFVSESTPKIKSIGPLITEKRSFKKWKILPTFARFISKIKKPDIFNFPSIKYFVKRFLFLKIWNLRVNYCRNYGLSNLLFYFTGHNLEKLNNGQRETAVNCKQKNKKHLTKYLIDGKLKVSGFFIFEIKRAKMDEIFYFLKNHFSVMSGPMDMIFGD